MTPLQFVPAAQWQPPLLPPAAIFGELSQDGTTIILIAQGDAWDMKVTGERLSALTPAVTVKDKGNNILSVPCTWPAVTQLAHSFPGTYGSPRWVPGPRLCAWVVDELTRRTSVHSPLIAEIPAGLALRPYQEAGARMIAAAGRFLLCDSPGVGKTCTTIAGLLERQARGTVIFPMVIIVPSWSVADVWQRELAAWAPGWRTALWGGPSRDMRKALDSAGILITTYATARVDANDADGPLAKLHPAAVVLDECVTHDTLVSTPGGAVPICTIRAGDLVLGVDHSTGRRIWAPVRNVMRSRLRPVVCVAGTLLSGEHPVWVSDGGSLCYANAYEEGRPDHLRVVRSASKEAGYSPGGATTPILQSQLLSEMANVPAGVRGNAGHAETTSRRKPEHTESAQLPSIQGLYRVRAQPVPGSGGPGEGTRNAREPGLAPVAGRERNGAYYPASTVARAARAALGAGASNTNQEDPGLWLPDKLQGGHRPPGPEGRGRSTRTGAWQIRESPGPQEEGATGVAGLDGAVDLERADPYRSLWNLETGTGNYFAGGILVHNCHMIKSARLTTGKGNSTVSAAARRIAAHAGTVAGLTGTPVTKDTGDIFTALSAMDPASWPSRERFVRRYCETSPGEYEETVTGLKQLAAPEFFACLTGAMRRVAKADVLDQLPPKIYSVRRVELPPDWRRAYDDLERDMLAELPGGQEISVMETLAQLTFLVQLASAAADVEITEETDEETGLVKKHYHAVLKAPSWKADELLEILAERKGQPVAVFAPSRQLIEVAGRACEKAGFRAGYITGTAARKERARAIDDFQAGKLDVILATTGAGGTGITLTAAGTVVFLQRPWSLAESIQAEDRCYRWGSEIHECIEVIDIVSVNTVEARVREALTAKAGQLSEVVRDPRIARELLGGLR